MTQDTHNTTSETVTETLKLTKPAKKRGGDQYSNYQGDMVFYFPQRITRAYSSTPVGTITIQISTQP